MMILIKNIRDRCQVGCGQIFIVKLKKAYFLIKYETFESMSLTC